MSDLPYQYATLRCVPRVEREEFVNVGVVLFCEEAQVLSTVWELDESRLLALDPDLDLVALSDMLATVDAVCAGLLPAVAGRRQGARFGWLTAPRSTVLQPGPRHGGLTHDPTAELERLRRVLVEVRR